MTVPKAAETVGAKTFNPDEFFDDWTSGEAQQLLYTGDFRKFLLKAFGLDPRDQYVYRAVAEVTLLQAQTYIELGGQNGFHAWYRDAEGQVVS